MIDTEIDFAGHCIPIDCFTLFVNNNGVGLFFAETSVNQQENY